MTTYEGITILAILLSPVIAVQITRYLDNKKEERQRKLEVFKTLMGTRARILSLEHVGALNRIDLEFDKGSKKEKAVIEAWKAYLDSLCENGLPGAPWEMKRVDLFVELMHKMAEALDYDFDKTHIKNSVYSPQAHGNIEAEQQALRKSLLEVLEGRGAVQMAVNNWPIRLSDGASEELDKT